MDGMIGFATAIAIAAVGFAFTAWAWWCAEWQRRKANDLMRELMPYLSFFIGDPSKLVVALDVGVIGFDAFSRAVDAPGEGDSMNLTRKRLEAIGIALDLMLLNCDDEGRIESGDVSITFADAKEARAWVAERIEKLKAGT